MNDRYLFRAKHSLESKRWHIGNLVEEPDGLYLRDNKNNIMVYIQDPSTICQCTGLKDKNGKLIWENDILSSGNLVVTWREELSSYCLTKKGWMYQHFFGEAVDACDCEVIGNIFDNPELMHE